MSKRYVAERRQRNLELAARDRANRCTECKRNLSEVGVIIEDFLIIGKFCSDECLEQYKARTERR